MIESSSVPGGRGVTLLARSGETGRDVVRIRSLVEVCLVTTNASRRCSLVLSVHVTLRTHQRLVCSGQWEPSRGVIELRAAPRCRVMALRARGRESSGNVIRVLRVVEVRLVATDTVRWSSLELSIGVALVAGQRDVSACKSEAGHRGMVKLGADPRRRAMALLAGSRES